MREEDLPWTADDVPAGPYYHGTRFHIEPGAPFDLAVPRSQFPDLEWGLVSEEDDRRMFWAVTDPDKALDEAYAKGLVHGGDRLYVWEVELDDPEVDTNMHSRWNTTSEDIENVRAASGRFVRIVRDIHLDEYINR